MVAKRSSRALALLLALPSAAFALGLGDIHLLSPLNSPLDAEIELVDVAPDEANTVQAQLASRETFARYGLDWPSFLGGVQVHTVHGADGRTLIKLKSSDPISEPFITLLVEVNWSHGRVVREYTMLLDPPVYTPGQSSAASAPVSAPSTGSGTREGSIARSAASTANTPPAAASETPATSAAPPATPSAAPPATSASAAPEPSSAASATGAAEGEGSTHVVHRGETLSQIAAAAAGESANTPRARSWMLAIYQGNPRAFDRNMNVLRSGAVLRMPDAASVSAVSPAQALAEIRRQTAEWRGTSGASGASAESTAAQPGRLKLVTPSEAPAAGTTSGAPSAEVNALKGQVHDLEGQLAEQKRLLALKDADLARLQAQLAAKQGAPPQAAQPQAEQPQAPPAAPTPKQPEAAATAPASPPAQATPPAAPPAAQPPEEQAPPAAQPPVAAAPKPAPAHKPTPVQAPAAGGSIFDTLKQYWWLLPVLLLALVAIAVVRMMRSRRASEFDDSLGRLAVAGAAGGSGPDLGSGGSAPRGFASGEAPMRAAAPAPAPEPTFLVEESGSHERPRLGAAAAPPPTPRHVASEDTISSDTAINLDQGDPLAEADFHMAYGLYDQAADLIRIAISREPARRDLKLKLLEVFFVWGNKEQFLQTARELAESRANAAPGEWEKILIMGKQLAPEDALFSGTAPVSGATAGGVDLDLEGGQSRVDFDLLGEPVAGDGPQSVDLDIGAAVGDATTESTTNVTDRNSALFEGSATATTRQMTQRVEGTGATGEMEGPTVEQPAIGSPDNATIRQKVETVLRQSGADQTAELAIDDLGLDVGPVDTVDQPGPAAPASSTPDSPTLVAGFDEHSRELMEEGQTREMTREMTREITQEVTRELPSPGTSSTGAWQFDQTELEEALTQTSLAPDVSDTARLAALKGQEVDVDLGEATGSMRPLDALDLDVGGATGSHPAAAGNGGLDLDVGTASAPDTAFAATQRLSSEELALPDLEPVTMSEVGTKLDLARAYMDMGDPDGARNILEEVLNEGSAAQKQEAQRLMESLPG
jgi:pilus assembly protein FimV